MRNGSPGSRTGRAKSQEPSHNLTKKIEMTQLSLGVCAICGTNVCPRSDGTCPSCRQTFVEATREQEKAILAEKRAQQAVRDKENVNWYLEALRKSAEFGGRSRRKEYWTFGLVNALVAGPVMIVDILLGGTGLVTSVFLLFLVMPGLAVSVRRLHDTDHSGWCFLISFIPIVGPILLLGLMLLESDSGDNRYGPNPRVTQDGT